MATPSYTTDLLDVTECESNTDWAEISGYSGGGADATETDFYIQNSACVSQSTGTQTNCGITYDYGSAITLNAGDVFLAWQIFLAPNAINTWSNGGVRFVVGNNNGDMKCFNAVGSDFGKYPYGGWQNTAIDPTNTADQTIGTPDGTWRWFGTLCNLVSTVAKGNPHGIDAIRYGRGELIIEHGDSTNGYGTFSGISNVNDSQTNKWGLLQAEGTGYLWKGLMSFGNTTNSCDFRDSNVNIAIDDTPRTYATFNKIEVNNASSNVEWTAVNFTALNPSQVSIGSFEAVDNATISKTNCVFTDMGTFIYQSNSTLTSVTYRRCGLVTVGGATFSKCKFEESDVAVSTVTDDLALLNACEFTSDGSNHAVELTTVGDGTMDWNCTTTGYDTGSTGSPVTPTNTGNEDIYVSATSGTVTISVASGATTPSIRSAGATVNVEAGLLPITITVKDASTGLPLQYARVMILRDDTKAEIISGETNASGVYSESVAASYNGVAYVGWVRESNLTGTDYEMQEVNGTIGTSGATISVRLQPMAN